MEGTYLEFAVKYENIPKYRELSDGFTKRNIPKAENWSSTYGYKSFKDFQLKQNWRGSLIIGIRGDI